MHFIVIDNKYYQAFDSEQDAQAVHDLAFKVAKDAPIWQANNGLYIDDTPWTGFEWLVQDNAPTQYKAIDIIGYITKKWRDRELKINRYPITKRPIAERLATFKRNKSLTGAMAQIMHQASFASGLKKDRLP